MDDLKARIRAKFSRRNSATHSLSSAASANAGTGHDQQPHQSGYDQTSATTSRPPSASTDDDHGHSCSSRDRPPVSADGAIPAALANLQHSPDTSNLPSIIENPALGPDAAELPKELLESKAPTSSIAPDLTTHGTVDVANAEKSTRLESQSSLPMGRSSNPGGGSHRQGSSNQQKNNSASGQNIQNQPATLIKALLAAAQVTDKEDLLADSLQNATQEAPMYRKVWVKRPGASPTLITVGEEDLVDDVRDLILRKYRNSLGKHLDSPDLTIRIVPRDKKGERTLGPEEHVCQTLDAHYPKGQLVDDALIIDVPVRKTPRPSPRLPVPHQSAYYADEGRPSEAGEGYFPPVGSIPSPHGATLGPLPNNTHAMSILSTGQPPPLGSPGGSRSKMYRERAERPRLGRTHTSSPTILGGLPPSSMAVAAAGDTSLEAATGAPPAPTLSSASPTAETSQAAKVSTPPARGASPRPAAARPKKPKTKLPDRQKPPVPPINVLLVEDNPINLKLLEAFAKGLKVRWQSAMNGQDAVAKWRKGGFHLVLMDIQLPVMNGLDATREIRRLERVNSIGVLSTSRCKSAEEEADGQELDEADRLANRNLFKSPVIIVALTASSLQSDRHEALAAGCNDFITKPVNLEWLERKVREWGCMQALIDFDGWRRWKDFSQEAQKKEEAEKKAASAKAAERKAAKFKRHKLSQAQPSS